jgi:hypothetical protein
MHRQYFSEPKGMILRERPNVGLSTPKSGLWRIGVLGNTRNVRPLHLGMNRPAIGCSDFGPANCLLLICSSATRRMEDPQVVIKALGDYRSDVFAETMDPIDNPLG